MAQSIDFDSITAANPWTSYPTGWQRTSPTSVQITTVSGIELFARSGGTGSQMGCIVNSTPITGNTIIAKRVHPANATAAGSTSQCVFHNASGNGYALEQDQAGTTTTFKLVVAYVVQATALQTFTSYGTGYNQTFELRCIDKTSGTFQFWRNGVQIGSNFTDTTYTGLEYAGVGGTGGRTRSIEVGELFAAYTITNPMTSGSAFGGTSAGAADGAGTIATGGQTVPITFAGGGTTYSGTWPAFADGLVYPVTNGSTLTFTIAQGASSTTINSVFNLPANYAYTPVGVVITDPAYLGSVYSLTTGWAIYYDETQLGGMEIFPDSRVDVTNDGTFTCFVHELGNGNDLVELTVTVNGGVIVSGGGLTSSGLVRRGLVTRGLVASGL